MLTELSVENLGIIDQVVIPLGPGLTAITGETGAGKTLLVTAIELLLGSRADSSLVRSGTEEARVDGRFLYDDEEVIVSRAVGSNGRSRAYLNGRPVTISEITEFTSTLAALHGQHDVVTLLHSAAQRRILDTAAKTQTLLDEYKRSHVRCKELDEAIAGLGGDSPTRAREIDLLRYQLAEINAAEIQGSQEDVELAKLDELLANAEEHKVALEQAYESVATDAVDAVGKAASLLHEPFTELGDQLRDMQDGLMELARDLRSANESVIADPKRLLEVQQRRQLLQDLKRKYGPELTDVFEFNENAVMRLEELEQHDERAAKLEKEHQVALQQREQAARRLSEARQKGAPKVAQTVMSYLHQLAMPEASFSIEVVPGAFGEDGADDVQFYLAANPGEASRPLAKAASGGELSRCMLALRVVALGDSSSEALVFDEIDAGIGGEVGIAVGRALATLATRCQVLCVTHLPQVAAFADVQIAVRKVTSKRRTRTEAEILLDDTRLNELARMLAGIGSEAGREHAQELLVLAQGQP